MYTILRGKLLALALLGACAGKSAAPVPADATPVTRPDVVEAEKPVLAASLAGELAALDRGEGRVGVCVQAAGQAPVCQRGDERFSLQSVMKVVVGMVVLDAVDAGKMKLEDPVLVTRQDASLGVQPIMKRVGKKGYQTTVGELVELAIIESDSAAVDILVGKLGKTAVQAWLTRQGVEVRIDRMEKELQAETAGLRWHDGFVDEKVFEKEESVLMPAARAAAWRAYIADPRDTATPRGMSELMRRLADGKLLSAKSTDWLLAVMERTVTGPNRLKAGLPEGWKLAHKTGTSGTREGLTVAVNDVGVLIAPDGTRLAIAVFVAESQKDEATREKLIADAAKAAAKAYQAR